MSRSGPERALDALPILLASWLIGSVLATFAARFAYLGDLEWMEGGMLSHAWRLQRGLPLFVEPGPEFIPFIYPPGYPALLAAAGTLVELDYPVGRALSILGTLAAASAILWIGVRQARSAVGGLVGAACYLGCFRACGGFLDLVRPDGVAMGLLAFSVVLATERKRGAEVASGLLLCAAFLVKHNMAIFGVPIVLALWLRDGWRSAARFVAVSAGPALTLTVLLQLRSEGRFLTYLLGVPRSHPMLWDRLSVGVPGELAQWLLVAGVVGCLALVASVPSRIPSWARALAAGAMGCVGAAAGALQPVINGIPMAPPPATGALMAGVLAVVGAAGVYGLGSVVRREWPDARWFMAFFIGLTALMTSGLMRAHYGGFMNVLLPAQWALAAGFAVGVGWVRARWAGPVAHGVTVLLMVGQLGWMVRQLELTEVIPTATEVEAGDALVDLLRERCGEGPVFAPHFAWIPTRLGQPPSLHLIALWDINHEGGPYFEDVPRIAAAARDHYWSCVVEGRQKIGYGVEAHYRLATPISGPARALVPQTGWRVRPTDLMIPRE